MVHQLGFQMPKDTNFWDVDGRKSHNFCRFLRAEILDGRKRHNSCVRYPHRNLLLDPKRFGLSYKHFEALVFLH